MKMLSRSPGSLQNPQIPILWATSFASSIASASFPPWNPTTISFPSTVMVWTSGSVRRNFTASQTFSTTWIRIGLESFTFFKISPMFPDRTTFPASMIPISVHIWASSERMWELTTMVFPSAQSSFKSSLNSILALGSMPDVGSSKTRSFGSWIMARARQSLCFIPLDRLSTKNSSFPASFTCSRSFVHRSLATRPESP